MIDEVIGQYKILEQVGEGGMGIVYKAEDTKLKRTVALKFLPEHLQASASDKARFVQEAQAASALNHPNVCTIHDIQEHDGRMFIVMELVQGQTLRALMKGQGGEPGGAAAGQRPGAIPLNRAIEFAIQVSEGLAAAHEKGITHRDVKPENIMVRKDGIVQIMDFGLAKLRSVQGSRLTKQGSTVGTAGYMSPEQIQGTDTDHRSDIFSLGVLMYEMFTGELPFKGVHESALLYEIVNVDPPPITVVNPGLSPEIDRIVFECLQKEPDERFQSVKDISKELKRFKRESSRSHATRVRSTRQYQQDPGGAGTAGTGGPMAGGQAHADGSFATDDGPGNAGASYGIAGGARRRGAKVIWPFISMVLALALGAVWFGRQPAAEHPDVPPMRFPVSLEVSSPLVLGAATLAIAPDGKNFVYLAGEAANPKLYIRPLNRLEPSAMSGSDGASDPFFSRDGRWVGFFAGGKLKKVSILGGGAQDICTVPGFMRGGTWSSDGEIYFGHLNRGIFHVPEAGGTPEEVTVLDTARGEISHRFPQSVPGTKWVIFTVKHNSITSFDDAVIAAENVETHERRELVRGGSYGRLLATGHIMYARGTSLYAIPFDPERIEVSGSPLPVLEGGMLNPFSGTSNFEVSDNGLLIYAPFGPVGIEPVNLSWMDRKGVVSPLIPEARTFDNPTLSPDGTRIAVTGRAANDDLWIYDIHRSALSRFTFGGGNSDLPVWTADGKEVIYAAERGRRVGLFRRSWDGSGPTSELLTHVEPGANSRGTVTPDGKSVIVPSAGDLWIAPIEGSGESSRLMQSSSTEDGPRLSPDGKILAYTSNGSGRNEIYAVQYPELTGKWQISTGGATSFAIWSKSSPELFYAEQGKLMRVEVTRTPRIGFSAPQVVCTLPPTIFGIYDIANDGEKFILAMSQSGSVVAAEINVVVGWFEELKQRFQTAGR